MAKRFTDTDLWDKEWFMMLSPTLKCLVKFVRDKCDLAGVWSPNWVSAKMYIQDNSISENALLAIDNGSQFLKLPNGKILCIDFIKFQYGVLSHKSPVHKRVFSILVDHNVKLDTLQIPYFDSIYSGQEKDKEKEKEEDKEKEKEVGRVGEITEPKKQILNKITIGQIEYEMLPSEFMRQNEDQMNYIHSQMETYLKGVELVDVFKKLDEVYNHTKFESENQMKFAFRTQGKWLRKKIEKEKPKTESNVIRQNYTTPYQNYKNQ